MRRVCFRAAVIGTFALGRMTSAADGPQSTPPHNTAQSQCKAMAGDHFSDVPDAPTQVTHTGLIEAADGGPTYCQIQGYIAPQVGFELRLPERSWNGKLIEVGCGGWCGYIPVEACDDPLARGYACIASDMGHKGTYNDVLWAQHNLQAQIDFGYRATHVVALAGKAIAERYYRAAPKHSYFVGCSTGGYQGVMEAQRFAWDFDGIIAGAPDIDESGANIRSTWIARSALDATGAPLLKRQTLELVHAAALASCDRDDGLRDGIIGNSRDCRVDLHPLLCRSGEGDTCLTPSQADAVNRLYSGPATSRGESLYPGGLPPGSELLWGVLWPTSAVEQYFKYGISGYSTSAGWKYTDFAFDRDYQRVGLAAYYDNSNPDLRKFRRAGGKLIVYHGGSDTIDLPGPVIDYYETAERTMGGRVATQEFFRLFVIPGMNHCTGGDGAWAIDYLPYLEAWVERGEAPAKLIGAHVSDEYLLRHSKAEADQMQTREEKLWGAASEIRLPLDPTIPVTFRRPIYPYPVLARYSGHGDPNNAENFFAVDPKQAR